MSEANLVDTGWIRDEVLTRMQVAEHLPPDEIGDIISEVGIIALQEIEDLEERATLGTMAKSIATKVWISLFRKRDPKVRELALIPGFFKKMDTPTLRTLIKTFSDDSSASLKLLALEEITSRPVSTNEDICNRFYDLKGIAHIGKTLNVPKALDANKKLAMLLSVIIGQNVDLKALGLEHRDLNTDLFYAQHSVYQHSGKLGLDVDEEEKRKTYTRGTDPAELRRIRRTSHRALREMSIEAGDYQDALTHSHKRIELLWERGLVVDLQRDKAEIEAYIELAKMAENATHPLLPTSPLNAYSVSVLVSILEQIPKTKAPLVRRFLLQHIGGATRNLDLAKKCHDALSGTKGAKREEAA